MPLVVSDLADAINAAMDVKDKDGNPIVTTSQMTAYAQAVIDTLIAGSVSNSTGTVLATALPVPGPVILGSASNGTMTLSSSVWSADLSSGFPTSDSGKLSSEASASVGYLTANGSISFPLNSINGLSTATPITPGTLTAGMGSGGQISGLVGEDWAGVVTGSQGLSNTDIAKNIYNAISNYIIANALVDYAVGNVNGSFAPGGGLLIAGMGSNGTIS
jgi:hypothetical protein